MFRQRLWARAVAADALSRAVPPARSLYIHTPFCVHKCHYCDFYSLVDTRDRQGAFTERLVRELAALAPLAGGVPLGTIFVGGGTPTLLAAEHWRTLLEALRRHYDLSQILAGRGEFTVECNPETASPELFDLLRSGGVDRLSLGAQSFDPRHLRTLERRHEPGSVARALAWAAGAGIARRSIDLIYAIPGQSIDDLHADLDRALSLPIDHLSAYTLTYEPNTAMTARLSRGEFEPASEETEAAMFELVGLRAQAAGLERYEISNFARPGSASRHNLAYWRQEDWIAAGPSASGHVGGHRYKVTPRLDDYLAGDDEGFAPIIEHEPPDERRLLTEVIMTGLRLAEGLDERGLRHRAESIGGATWPRLEAAAQRAERAGHMQRVEGRWSLTPVGLLLGDAIAADLMAMV